MMYICSIDLHTVGVIKWTYIEYPISQHRPIGRDSMFFRHLASWIHRGRFYEIPTWLVVLYSSILAIIIIVSVVYLKPLHNQSLIVEDGWIKSELWSEISVRGCNTELPPFQGLTQRFEIKEKDVSGGSVYNVYSTNNCDLSHKRFKLLRHLDEDNETIQNIEKSGIISISRGGITPQPMMHLD
jgi:hypothetical protein